MAGNCLGHVWPGGCSIVLGERVGEPFVMTLPWDILFTNRHQVSSVSIGATDSVSLNFSNLGVDISRRPSWASMLRKGLVAYLAAGYLSNMFFGRIPA